MRREETIRHFAMLLPLFILMAVGAGFIAAIYLNRTDFALRGISIAVPAILAAIFLILLYRSRSNLLLKKPMITGLSHKRLTPVFALLYAASILLLVLSPDKEWPFYVLTSAIAVVILLQVFSDDMSAKVVLSEIILSLLMMIYGVTLTQPLYFGWTDILPHLFDAQVTYLSGHTIPADLDYSYVDFPLYHILIAEGSMFSGLDMRTALFAGTAPVFSSIIIAIYHIFDKAIADKRVALLACLAFAFNSTVLFYGAYMVTRVMAFVGFLFMLYCLYKREPPEKDGRVEKSRGKNIAFYALAVLMAAFIILVHQVSVVQMSALLLILLLCERALRSRHYIGAGFYALFNVMFAAYWLFVAYDFANIVFERQFNQENFAGGLSVSTNIAPVDALSFLLTNLDMSFFLFFALIGIGYIAWTERKKYAPVLCLFALACLLLYVPNPIQTLWQTMKLFRFDRFVLLLSPFMAFAMGAGVYIVFRYLNSAKIPVIACVLAVAVLFGGYALASSDLKYVLLDQPREYFNGVELDSFAFINGHVPMGAQLFSDYYGARFFKAEVDFSLSEALGLPHYNTYTFLNASIGDYDGYKIIRYKELEDKGLYLGPDDMDLYELTTMEERDTMISSLLGDNMFYSNGYINAYYPASMETDNASSPKSNPVV
jgi:hypothetical protein